MSDKSDVCVSTGRSPQEERVNSSDLCENLGRQETVIPDFALETGLAKAMVGRKVHHSIRTEKCRGMRYWRLDSH